MSGQDDNYRLCVVRHAPLVDPIDLAQTLDWIVRQLEREDPVLFALSGYSPAMELAPALDGEVSRVGAFLVTSEIEWNFGREPADPTHEVVLFNNEEDTKLVHLRVSFVAGEEVSTGPGLVAELRLGRDAAGPRDAARGAHLDKLFSLLVVALRPDFGHVELPGHPVIAERPASFDIGWITYFASTERALPAHLPPPSVRVPMETGTKIFATPLLALEKYGDVAREIQNVREALQFKPPAAPATEPPPAAVSVQRPTFMLQPPEDPVADVDPEKIRREPLPFGPASTRPPAESQRRFDATPFHPTEPPAGDTDPEDPERR
jgi:hypothetical protein